jgi:hypothetical protein
VDRVQHKNDVVDQFIALPAVTVFAVDHGIDFGMAKVSRPDPLPHPDRLVSILESTASLALAAITAEVGAFLIAPLLEVEHAIAATSMRGILKGMFQLTPTPREMPLDDLMLAFTQLLKTDNVNAFSALQITSVETKESLRQLPIRELEALTARLSARLHDTRPLTDRVAFLTMVGWTNFLARARYGAMSGWDYWVDNGSRGAIALAGATDTRDGDPTRHNVEPAGVDKSLDGWEMHHDLYGVMEIFLDREGRLIAQQGYGMRLDNLSSAVRAQFRTQGKVRDLKINKLVRLCTRDPNCREQIASLLITADGYVRRTAWGGLLRVHMAHHKTEPWEAYQETHDCFEHLMQGEESTDCHLDHEANTRSITALAERAQDLSLSLLEA